MRRALVICGLLLGCPEIPNQFLTSPCVGQAATAAGGQCPQCAVDTDCHILTNLCQPTSYCVSTTSNWVVSTEKCSVNYLPLPEGTRCGCVDTVCQSQPPAN